METQEFTIDQAKYELGMIVRMLDEKLGRDETTNILREVCNLPF